MRKKICLTMAFFMFVSSSFTVTSFANEDDLMETYLNDLINSTMYHSNYEYINDDISTYHHLYDIEKEKEEEVYLSDQSINRAVVSDQNMIFGVSSSNSIQGLFSDNALARTSSVTLQQFSLSINDSGIVEFSGELSYGMNNSYIISMGNAYRYLGLGNYSRDEGIILLDFDRFDNYHFVQTRVNINNERTLRDGQVIAGGANLSIILQHIHTEELFHFEKQLDRADADKLLTIANETDGEHFFQMLDVSRNLVAPYISSELYITGVIDTYLGIVTVEAYDEYGVVHLYENTFVPYGIDGYSLGIDPMNHPFNQWNAFFNDLTRFGNSMPGWFNIDRNLISVPSNQVGTWQIRSIDYQYTIASFSRANGRDEIMVHISMVEFIPQFSNSVEHRFRADILHMFTLRYNRNTGWAEVWWHNNGLSFNNFNLTMFKNRNAPATAVYTSRIINGRFRTTPSFLRAAIGLTRAGSVFDFFDALSEPMDQRLGTNWIVLFPETYQQQRLRRNEVTRAINVTTGNSQMDGVGHFIQIDGRLYNGRNNSSNVWWNYTVNTR